MAAFVLALFDDRASLEQRLDAGTLALGGFARSGWAAVRGARFCARVANDPVHSYAGAGSNNTTILIDGWLSPMCRQRLVQHGIGAGLDCKGNDASLLALAWNALGTGLAALLDGDFAAAIFEQSSNRLWLLRSRSGARGLYYVRDGRRLLVATRAGAAIAVAAIDRDENPEAVAAYFALRAPCEGSAFFRRVSALPAGAQLVFDGQDLRISRVPSPESANAVSFVDDKQAEAAWSATLTTAVADALSDCARPAVMLSGGIDSSMLAAFGIEARADLVGCSWRLPATPESDESSWIAETAQQLGMPVEWVEGDQLLPLVPITSWLVEDDGPLSNPYSQLQQGVYAAAAAAGCDRMMSGNFGDHLYPSSNDWLRSGIADRGLGWAITQHIALLRTQGMAALWRDRGWRTLLRGARDSLPSLWSPPSWLQPEWRGRLLEVLGQAAPDAGALSPEAIQDAEFGRRLHCRHGIELLNPYRDPRVTDMAAALPAHYFFRGGIAKWLSREIMRGRLPERVRTRAKAGSLVPFFRKGVLDLAAAEVAKLLDAPDARWPRYVAPAALQAARDNAARDADLLLIWLCVGYELWWRAHWASGPAVLASTPAHEH